MDWSIGTMVARFFGWMDVMNEVFIHVAPKILATLQLTGDEAKGIAEGLLLGIGTQHLNLPPSPSPSPSHGNQSSQLLLPHTQRGAVCTAHYQQWLCAFLACWGGGWLWLCDACDVMG